MHLASRKSIVRGETLIENLHTLCEACNQGRSDFDTTANLTAVLQIAAEIFAKARQQFRFQDRIRLALRVKLVVANTPWRTSGRAKGLGIERVQPGSGGA
jgi:hypothetical protein